MGARSNGAGGFRGFRNTSVSDILSSTDSQRMANMLTRCSCCGNTGSPSPRPPYVHAIACLLAPIQWDWRKKPPCYSLSIFIPKRGRYRNSYTYQVAITSLTEYLTVVLFFACRHTLPYSSSVANYLLLFPPHLKFYFFHCFFITLPSPSHSKDYVTRSIFRLRTEGPGD